MKSQPSGAAVIARGDDWTVVGGIDPGTRVIGAALLSVRGQDIQPMDVRAWKVVGESIEERVGYVGKLLEEWIPTQGVKLIGVENGYVGKNARTALAIAMSRGVAVRAAQRGGAHVELVDPGEARKAIGAAKYGDKRKDAKARVLERIRLLLRLGRQLTEDEADACAVAMWAANRVWRLERGI